MSVLAPVRAAPDLAIVDTLGAATPATKFDRDDREDCRSVRFSKSVQQFTLNKRTVITEIGGFIADGGVFGTAPVVVQIRPSLNGNPDPSTILATFELSSDDDPLVTSYESVTPGLHLGAGSASHSSQSPTEVSPTTSCCAVRQPLLSTGQASPTLGALCSGTPCQAPPRVPRSIASWVELPTTLRRPS